MRKARDRGSVYLVVPRVFNFSFFGKSGLLHNLRANFLKISDVQNRSEIVMITFNKRNIGCHFINTYEN